MEANPLTLRSDANEGDVICIFGSVPLVKNAEAVQAELAAVMAGGDVEAIHRIRVASRRLRSSLQIFEKCLPAKK